MSDDRAIHFGTLHSDGTLTDQRVIKVSNIMSCPFFIMMQQHYRDDGSCRCDDPTHTEMVEWEYRWNKAEHKWVPAWDTEGET